MPLEGIEQRRGPGVLQVAVEQPAMPGEVFKKCDMPAVSRGAPGQRGELVVEDADRQESPGAVGCLVSRTLVQSHQGLLDDVFRVGWLPVLPPGPDQEHGANLGQHLRQGRHRPLLRGFCHGYLLPLERVLPLPGTRAP
jgi:hypothetical protein